MDAINFLDVNSYTALVAAVVNFTLALLVMLRTTRETVYVTFALACLGVAWWNFWDFMVYASGSSPVWVHMGLNVDTPWKHIVAIGSTLAAAAMFHFTLALVERLRGNRVWIVLAYIMAAFLALSPIAARYNDAMYLFWAGPGWNLAFFILLFPFILASLILVVVAYRDARGEEEGQWLKYVLAAGILQVATGVTDLFQKIFPVLPPLGHLGSVIGPVILAIGVFRYRTAFDILAQAREKLDLISNTAAEVAHEIGNPLTAIKGVVQLQAGMDNEPDLKKIRQYQDIMMREIERMESILSSLQDLTKPLRIEKETVDVNDVLGKTVHMMNPHLTDMKIDLLPGGDLPHINADPSLLKQIFLNLVRNASEACGQEGKLQIRTSLDHDFVRLEFMDNGPGVPVELKSRIFEPFFTTKESGLGLGLMVVSRIVGAHGGRISIDNIQPSGARITLLIPR